LVAPVQVGAAKPLDIPGQKAILVSNDDAVGGVLGLAPGGFRVHVPATVWFGFVTIILIILI
jgi:hypothetical protein